MSGRRLPTLLTPRLKLRPVRAGDRGFLISLETHPLVTEHLYKGPLTPERAREYADNMIRLAFLNFSTRWIAEIRRSRKPVGRIELFKFSVPGGDTSQVAYLFAPQHWKHGYATESLQAVLSFAFGQLGRDRVAARTRPDNQASIRLLERCGFLRSRQHVSDEAGVACDVWWAASGPRAPAGRDLLRPQGRRSSPASRPDGRYSVHKEGVSMATSRVFTDEEVLKLPKSARSIVDGEVRFVMGASRPHEKVVALLTTRLVNFVEAQGLGEVYGSNVMYRFASGNMYEPDASFIAAVRLVGLPNEGTTKVPPDLAVEVVSPEQPGEVAEKLYEYTRAGVRLVWIVDPDLKTGLMAHDGRVINVAVDGTLEGFDVLPGFSLPLAEILG